MFADFHGVNAARVVSDHTGTNVNSSVTGKGASSPRHCTKTYLIRIMQQALQALHTSEKQWSKPLLSIALFSEFL